MITLVPFTADDFDSLITWSATKEIMVQFSGSSFEFPITREQLADTLTEPNRKSFAVKLSSTGETIGHAGLQFENGTALLCRILIGDPGQRGKGFGNEIVAQLLYHAFLEPGIHEATLNVFAWNEAAIHCYKKHGFAVVEGREIMRTVNGNKWKLLHMRRDRFPQEYNEKG